MPPSWMRGSAEANVTGVAHSGAVLIVGSTGPPQATPPPSSYVPHSSVVPLQVPTVPLEQPSQPHVLPSTATSGLSQTHTAYLHTPHTHTVVADVHAPHSPEPIHTAARTACTACTACTSRPTTYKQPQSTAGIKSQSVTVTQVVPNSAIKFNALPVGLSATADTVVPPSPIAPPLAPPTTQATPTVSVAQPTVLCRLCLLLLSNSLSVRSHSMVVQAGKVSKNTLSKSVG